MRFPRLTIACLVLGVTGVAATGVEPGRHPVFATGETLRTWCLGRGAVRASCLGYLAGVVDVLRTAGASGAPCLPRKLAGEQVRLLFLDHLHRFPARADRAAATLVRDALLASFGCGDPREPPRRDADRLSAVGTRAFDRS